MIEGERIEAVELNSTWEGEVGEGCELSVLLEDGQELFVMRTGLEDAEAELASWRDSHVGAQVAQAESLTSWPLEEGGTQHTLDVTLEDGTAFEGDLVVAPERRDTGEEDLETEWTFEGQPGVEMGTQRSQREED